MVNFKIKKLSKTSFDKINELPDVVFFDYDGTIVDNAKTIAKAFKYSIKQNFDKKKDFFLLNEIKKNKSDSDKWSYIKNHCDLKVFEKCNQDYSYFLSTQRVKKKKGLIKILKLLKKIKIKVFVVSQKDGNGLRNELLKLGLLNKYIQNAYGTLDFGKLQKPSIEFLTEVEKKTKTKTKKKWIIGDTYSDVLTALNIKGKAFIIDKNDYTRIVDNKKELIGEKIFFTSYDRLRKFIKKLKKVEK